MFLLFPLVDIAIKVSTFLLIAMYSRLKTLSYEKSFAHAERLERLHPKVIDDIGCFSQFIYY